MNKQRKLILLLSLTVLMVAVALGGYFLLRPDKSVTVTLDEPKNGSVSFLGSEDTSIKVKAGETVKLKVVPDAGYDIADASFSSKDEKIELKVKNDTIEFKAKKTGHVSVIFSKYVESMSKRLIVTADDPSMIMDKDHVVSQYGNVYVMQFDTEEAAKQAYDKYNTAGVTAEQDSLVIAADPGSNTANNETADDATVSGSTETSHGLIALIDTGASEHDNVISRVSVIDGLLSGNGHGDSMVSAITSQDPNAKILSIRALDDSGCGTVSSVIAAMEHAIEHEADIINLSLYAKSTTATSALEAEIEKAVSKGIIVVGAAGNSGSDVKNYMPGSVDPAYIISACDESGKRIGMSNFGSTVDYHVKAGSTSEASALFTGFISANGLDNVKNVLNQGLIFEADRYMDEDELSNESVKDDAVYLDGMVQLRVNMNSSKIGKLTYFKDGTRVNDFADADTLHISYPEGLVYVGYRAEDWSDAGNWPEDGFKSESQPDFDWEVYDSYETDLSLTELKKKSDHIEISFQPYVSSDDLLFDFHVANGFHDPAVGEVFTANMTLAADKVKGGIYNGSVTVPIPAGFNAINIQLDAQSSSVVTGNLKCDCHFAECDVPGHNSSSSPAAPKGAITKPANITITNIEDTTQYRRVWVAFTWNPGHERQDGDVTCQVMSGSGWYDLPPVAGELPPAPPKCKLRIQKVSADPAITNGHPCYDFNGAAYTVRNLDTGENYGPITVGSDGFSGWLEGLSPGNYEATEYSVPGSSGYSLNGVPKSKYVSANEEATIIMDGASAEVPITDPLSILVQKRINAGTLNAGEAMGNIKLGGIVFQVDYYAGYYNLDNLPAVPNQSAKFVTDDRGLLRFLKATPVEGTSWNYKNSVGDNTIPLGTVIVREVSSTEGLTINTSVNNAYAFWLSNDGNNNIVRQPFGNLWSSAAKPDDVAIGVIDNDIWTGGVTVYKADKDTGRSEPQGDGSLAGITYKIYNISDNPVVVNGRTISNVEGENEIMTITTSSYMEGDEMVFKATTGNHVLPYGSYRIEEISANSSYNKASWVGEFSITKDGEMKEFRQPTVINKDPIKRGSVKVQKADADTATTQPQGDGSLEGIRYEIRNKSTSRKSVVVKGHEYAYDEVVMTITTDENGVATTAEGNNTKILPYGTYTIRELPSDSDAALANSSYKLPSDGWEATFKIRRDGEVVEFTRSTGENMWNADQIVHGGVKVQKADADDKADKTKPQGDGSLAGITYEITNKSNRPVKVDGTLYAKNRVVKTIITNEDGIATTEADTLPYGTYTIKEVSANESYSMPSPAWEKTFEIRKDGKIVEFTTDDNWNEDDIKRGGVTVYKRDSDSDKMLPQGDATLEGVVYKIENISERSVVVNGKEYAPGKEVMRIETVAEETGNSDVFDSMTYIATTGGEKLPYGTYRITEVSAPDSYINANWTKTFTIRRDGQMETYDLTNGNENDVVRGSLSVVKVDADTLRSEPQGDADLVNTIYSVTNRSQFPVYVRNVWYYPGDKIMDIATVYDAAKGQYIASTASDDLPVGTYQVVEETPPLGYNKKPYDETISLRPGNMNPTLEKKSPNPVKRGAVIVGKADADWHTSSPQGDATLNGVEYTIYNRSKRNVVVTIGTTKKEVPVNGVVTTITTSWNEARHMHTAQTPAKFLPYGTYEIVETRNSVGYLNAGWRKTFQIREDGQLIDYTGISEWNENPVQRGAIIVGKVDRETGQYISLGEADLAGATFEITNRSLHPVYVNGRTYNPGDVCLTMATEEMEWEGRSIYAAFTGERVLPYGTYEVREVGTGTGYLFDSQSKAYVKTVQVRSDGQVIDLTDEGSHRNLEDFGSTVGNQVRRQDFHFQKKDDNTQDRMANVAFLVTSLTTGEKHIIVTDENGTWGSASTHYEKTDATQSGFRDHTQKTNANDPTSPISNGSVAVGEDGNWYVVDSSKLDSEAGTWFTGVAPDALTWKKDSKGQAYYTLNDADYYPDDDLRAFPYDRYLVEELACDANEGHNLITVHVTLHRYTADHDGLGINLDYGTLFDDYVTLDTYLTFNTTGKTAPCRDDVDIIDQVAFSGLSSGDYQMVGELWLLSEDGKTAERKVAQTEMSFKIQGSFMMRNVEFNLDTRPLGGRTLVAYEYIYKDGQLVVKHEDPTDPEQQIKIIYIDTVLEGDCGHVSRPTTDSVTLVDTIKYDGLKDGRYYTATGVLVDKETGLPLVDGSGNEVMTTTRFVAAGESGSADVPFTFSGIDLRGKTVVAYETITRNNIEYAVHDDLNDEDQSVHYPDIDTYAADAADANKEIAEATDQSVRDAVKVTNLVDGYEYKLAGELHVRGKDGQDEGVIKTAETTWEGSSPDHVVTFEGIDASELGGKDLVAFQTLYGRKDGDSDWVLLLEHKDIMDDDQAVHVPHIGTTMLTSQGLHEIQVPEDGMVTLTDKVSYENLTPGHEYVVYGMLHKTADGSSTKVTANTPFTPETSGGSVNVTFTFNAKEFAGQSVTMFELLYSSPAPDHPAEWAAFFEGLGGTFDKANPKDEWVVAAHEDIKDEGQTIHFVEVETTLTEKDNLHMYQVTGDGMVTLTDTVKYTNLIPGSTYTISGVLHVQNVDENGVITDGGTVKDKDGNDVTESVTFKAPSADGSVDIPFTFDATYLSGRTVTAFESVSRDGITFAAHAKITDEGQSEHFVEIGTTALAGNGLHLTQAPKGDDKTVTITDTVAFKNLIPGLEYTMTGTLHLQQVNADGTITDAGILKDKDGNDVTKAVKFTPDEPNGSVDIEFTVDASELNAKTVVAYEQLTVKGILLATHEEIEDEGQAVHFADLQTLALSETGLREIQVREGEDANISFTDTVSYENLIPGLEYTLTGTVHLQDVDSKGNVTDGGILVGSDESPVTGRIVSGSAAEITGGMTFVPKTANGTVDMTFEFDAASLHGRTIVVYEAIAYDGVQFASHEDITEEGQSIYFVDIGTEALTEDGLHITQADEGLEVTITDSVRYENLIPGKTYTVTGTLHVKETNGEGGIIDGGVAKDGKGNDIVQSTTFVPKEPNGHVDVIFTFDSSNLIGKTVVAFESMSRDDIEFAVHADITDADQSVNLVGIKTEELADNGLHMRQLTEDREEFITLTDTFFYENVIPGMEYTVKGTLHDRDTGIQFLDSYGHPIASEITFTPDMPNGSVELSFEVKVEDIIGASVVAYEKLYYGDIQIGRHEDLEDENQTVHFVDIGTTALTEDGLHEYQVDKDDPVVTIKDRVKFENLIPGLEYTIGGVLHVKGTDENGEAVDLGMAADSDGNEIVGTLAGIGTWGTNETTGDAIDVTGGAIETTGDAIDVTGGAIEASAGAITGEYTFVPNVADGYVDMEFTFDAYQMTGYTAVAFEYLMLDDVIFATHEDITDEDQSIHFVDMGTTARTEDGLQEIQVSKENPEVTIIDTVAYENLIPGNIYTVNGTLHIQGVDENGSIVDEGAAKDKGGREVTGSACFVPTSPDGSVDVKFTFDASKLGSKTVVAFESISHDGVEFAAHEDITDKGQSIHLVDLGTTALTENGLHIMKVPDGKDKTVTITDTVRYENLIPGNEYTIDGVLHYKRTTEYEDGEPVSDGGELVDVSEEAVTATKTFIAEQPDGSVDLVFTFDAYPLEGETLVAFETMSRDGIAFAEHADIKDEDQSVHFPKIRTTAKADNGKHTVRVPKDDSKTVIITDTISYENLIPGLKYTASGELHVQHYDKSGKIKDGGVFKDASGNAITGQAVFMPKEPDGTIDVTFEVNTADMPKGVLVAFESVSHDGHVVGEHKDIRDKSQSVWFLAPDEPEPTPEPTKKPEPTNTPEPTKKPEPTKTPGTSETPEPTKAPGASGTPGPTKVTEKPKDTSAPAGTPAPSKTPSVWELVKTGQGMVLIPAAIGLVLMSGGGYFFFKKTRKGRSLMKRFKDRFLKK